MSEKHYQEHHLTDQIYAPPQIHIGKLVGLGLGFMALGFLLNFPLSQTLTQKIEAALFNNPACPMQAQQSHIRLFPPKIELEQVRLSGTCFSNPSSDLQLHRASVYLARPSFYPIGLLFRLDVKTRPEGQERLLFDLGVGIPSPKFRLHPSVLEASTLNTLLAQKNLLQGQFKLEGQGGLSWGGLDSFNLIISSSNLVIPSQNIQGLELPTLNLKDALLKARLSDGKILTVEELVLGSESSPLTGTVTGTIELNPKLIPLSELSLVSELTLSQDLINSFPIINLFLGTYQQGSGQFRFGISGNLNSPRFSRP